MGSTSRNTFQQCGKWWILPRKTKVGNEGITSKIGPIDLFKIRETIPSSYLSDKVDCFGHSLLKPFVFLNVILVIPSMFYE